MAGEFAKNWYSKALEIPIDEMVTEYRQARDKNKQIEILADLCGTKACRIAWILGRCGLAVDVKKMPRAQRNPDMPDYVAFWEKSGDAVICDRLRKQIQDAQSMPEFDADKETGAVESELTKELVRKDAPPEEVQGNGCAEEIKRLRYIKPKEEEGMGIEGMPKKEYEPGEVVTNPGKALAEAGDHGVYRIVAELWTIYLDKLRERGVKVLGTVEVLKMQDMKRIVHELVEGM